MAIQLNQQRYFPGAKVACASRGLGSKKVGSSIERIYLFAICEGVQKSDCNDVSELDSAGVATLAENQRVHVVMDNAQYDPPYSNWIQKHFPMSLWPTANNPSKAEHSELQQVVTDALSC